MQHIYHWLGFLVFWGAVAVALKLGYEYLPERMREEIKDYWLWLRTYVLRCPRRMKEEQVEMLMRWFQRPRALAPWKRNLLAYTIRYSRRKGYKPAE